MPFLLTILFLMLIAAQSITDTELRLKRSQNVKDDILRRSYAILVLSMASGVLAIASEYFHSRIGTVVFAVLFFGLIFFDLIWFRKRISDGSNERR